MGRKAKKQTIGHTISTEWFEKAAQEHQNQIKEDLKFNRQIKKARKKVLKSNLKMELPFDCEEKKSLVISPVNSLKKEEFHSFFNYKNEELALLSFLDNNDSNKEEVLLDGDDKPIQPIRSLKEYKEVIEKNPS